MIELSKGVTHELPDTAIFGRNTDSTICLPDVRVSRRHAMIRKQDENQWWFYDLGSYNGSYLNGRRVTTTCPLQPGDVVRICDFSFRFDWLTTGKTANVPILLNGQAQELTLAPMIILVSDIKGFTRLSELLPPEDLAQAIGTWYGACEQILSAHGAAIDKFIGDAVLAYWTDVSEAARAWALNAAKALRQATNDIHDSMRLTFDAAQSEFACGVALHLGEVSHGILSPGTLTMLGDAVNTTFRIQSLTRSLGSDILASGNFFEEAPPWLQGKGYCHPLGTHDLRGRSNSIDLFSVESCPADFA
ncbi:MAG: FHA domain-containing protein [Verrucomicrobiales bacterium]